MCWSEELYTQQIQFMYNSIAIVYMAMVCTTIMYIAIRYIATLHIATRVIASLAMTLYVPRILADPSTRSVRMLTPCECLLLASQAPCECSHPGWDPTPKTPPPGTPHPTPTPPFLRTEGRGGRGPSGPLGPFGAQGDRLYATKVIPNVEIT